VARLEKGLNLISSILIMGMGFLVSADVICRYGLNSPVPGTFEFVEFMMVGIVFLALSRCQAQGAQIRVTVVLERIHAKIRSFLNILALLAGLIVLVLIVWSSGVSAWEAWQGGHVTFGLYQIPEAPARSLVPFGAAVASVRIMIDLLKEVTKHRNSNG
jgi:TRAP-type C4-dicarboxylate transport system permease small subunit